MASQVRSEERLPLGPGDALDGARRLPVPFAELPESGMSELCRACEDAGLRDFVIAALKLPG